MVVERANHLKTPAIGRIHVEEVLIATRRQAVETVWISGGLLSPHVWIQGPALEIMSDVVVRKAIETLILLHIEAFTVKRVLVSLPIAH